MLLFDEDKLKAVAYYRHSAEDKQENSVDNQREQVEQFAAKEDIQIVEHFQDEGISGLTANRPGFQEMFAKWVTNPTAPKIDYILVYDASRFGRFQKMSEVWRLLRICEERDISLATVMRGLPKEKGSVMDSFIITLDFSMSGETSKTLSEKVSYGSAKIASQGYSVGGCAPYGYVRVLLNEERERVRILEHKVHKEVSNQRVSFEPAKTGEAKIVQRIYREFVARGRFPNEIADGLNNDGIPTAKGRLWNSSCIIRILTNETYIGTRVWGKTWGRLKEDKRAVPSNQWVRCPNAHKALVDTDTFHKAQERLYWLRPKSRTQNSRKIKTVQSYVSNYLEELIADFNEDQKHYIRRFTPISFGVNYLVNEDEKTCFYIPPQQNIYDELLLCSIDLDAGDTAGLQSVYKLESADLKGSSYVVIDNEAPFSPLEHDELKDTLLGLVSKVVQRHAPWLSV